MSASASAAAGSAARRPSSIGAGISRSVADRREEQRDDRQESSRSRRPRSPSWTPTAVAMTPPRIGPIGIVPQTMNRIVAFIRPCIALGRDRLAEAHLVDVVDHARSRREARRRRGTGSGTPPARCATRSSGRPAEEHRDRRSSGRRRAAPQTRFAVRAPTSDADVAEAEDDADLAGVEAELADHVDDEGRERDVREQVRGRRCTAAMRAQVAVAQDVAQALRRPPGAGPRAAGRARRRARSGVGSWRRMRKTKTGRDEEADGVGDDRDGRRHEPDQAAADAPARRSGRPSG